MSALNSPEDSYAKKTKQQKTRTLKIWNYNFSIPLCYDFDKLFYISEKAVSEHLISSPSR